MNKFTLSALLLSSMLASPLGVFAQSAAPAEKSAMKDAAEAEVRKIDKDAKKVTLKHGPIKNLDMPGMTMVFQVKDPALMDKMAVGDKIMFTAEQQQGAYVVTDAQKAPAK